MVKVIGYSAARRRPGSLCIRVYPRPWLFALAISSGFAWPLLAIEAIPQALLLCQDRGVMLPVLQEGSGELALDFQDCLSSRGAIVIERQRMSPRIDGWSFRIAEHPGPGEFRYLRFSWKKRGGGGVMLEFANAGQWVMDQNSAQGRYTAGANTTGWAAIPVAAETPSQWVTVTRDLWKDLGDWTITGLCLTSIGGEAALYDSIILSSSLEHLDLSPSAGDATKDDGRSSNAWTDPRNPVGKRFDGRRLDLWSLRRPTRPPLPAVQQADWPRDGVDQFILSDLEAHGLAPSAQADRRTLIRRLSYDLLGLPPTAEEVQAFEGDNSPDAYEQLVDRMLSSPHYGERWGRHWLDVARYADTNGFERDEFRPTMWRYRDYVIRALNSDKPYDEFVREQLAGDEIADSYDVEKQIATGYLRCGPFDSTKDGPFDGPAQGRDQLMVDLVNSTGSAFLGATMACCRCHDHKTEPLLQADHYRLRAFFAAVQFTDVILDKPEVQTEITAHNNRLDAAITPLNLERRTIRDGGGARVAAELRTTFPVEIQQALLIPEAQRDEATQSKLQPFLRQLTIREEESLKALTAEEKSRYDYLVAQIADLEKQHKKFVTALGMRDAGNTAIDTHILEYGDFNKPLDTVQPGMPSVFDPNAASIHAEKATSTGRRKALADWTTSPENPWTARVMVNRLWQHHFGRGIVATPDDFGYSGARPTHPQLLDWLAVEFMEHGWSMKHMQRLMVLSASYRQASFIDARASIDPGNRYYWRQSPRRLDAESLRDAVLSVAGRLLPCNGGPPLWPEIPLEVIRGQPSIFEQTDRLQGYYTDPVEKTDVRSIFLVRKRGIPLPFLQVFNLPDGSCTCGRRDVTTVAPQALVLLNNSLIVRLSDAFAQRLELEAGSDLSTRIDLAVRLAFGRDPDDGERQLLTEQFARLKQLHTDRQATISEPGAAENQAAEHTALAEICRALFNTNEFVYID